MPLSKDLVESVSAALKEAGLKSAAQYLAELRLMHIEAGYEVESWLKRTFDLCRKALERNAGPTLRAVEVKLEGLDTRKLDARAAGQGRPEAPVRLL